MPWRDFLKTALGVFHWSPSEFWNSTPIEFYAAFEGWQLANGVNENDRPMTRREFERLRDKLE